MSSAPKLSARLRKNRIKKHLSTAEMAKLLNVSVRTYRYWEAGKFSPSAGNLLFILKYLKK